MILSAAEACDLARDLCERGFLRPIQAAQPSAVADLLADAVAAGTDGQVVAQAQASLAERLHPDVVAAPLQRWVENPGRAPTGSGASQEVLRQLEATRAELEAVYATPTWRLLSTLHGLVKRLTGSS